MTSASTKKRKAEDAALLATWAGTPIGAKITVHRANGHYLRTTTLCEPFALHAGAYVRVTGIDGNTHLRRLTPGWNAATESRPSKRMSNRERMGRLFAAKDAEIQRLRAAMVHAMDDCAQAARDPYTRLHTASRLDRIARRLKAALEKK